MLLMFPVQLYGSFYTVSLNCFSEDVSHRNMLIMELTESNANLGGYVLVEGGVKPHYISFWFKFLLFCSAFCFFLLELADSETLVHGYTRYL